MNLETLISASIQTSVVFLVVWLVFRLVPSIPANTRSWIWRLAFLKPLVMILPFAALTLHVLPAKPVLVSPQNFGAHGHETASISATGILQTTAGNSIDPWTAVWWVGVAFLFLSGIISSVRFSRVIRDAEKISDPEILSLAQDLYQAAGIRRPVSLRHSEQIATPLLVGIKSPTILIPSGVITGEVGDDLRMMLAHEIAHLARRDSGWFVYFWAVQTLLFFNPVIWFATRCARLDHESATDEYASQLADVPVQTYAEMLLRATVVTRGPLAPGAAPMSESYRSIHRRLEAMKHFKKPSTPMRKTATIALAFAVVGLLPLYQFAEASSDGSQEGKPLTPASLSVDNATVKVVQGKPLAPIAPSPQPKPGDAAPIAAPSPAPIVVPGRPTAPRPSVDARPGVAPLAKPAPVAKQAKKDKELRLAPDITRDGRPGIVVAPRPAIRADNVLIQGRALAPKDAEAPSPLAKPVPDGRIAPSRQSKDALAPISRADSVQGTDPLQPKTYDIIVPVSLKGQPSPPRDAFKEEEPQDFSIEMNGAQIEETVRLLCKSAKKEYVIDSQVKGPVNVKLEKVSFRVALEAVVNSVNATYRVENGVYHIVPK